jgi:hypothetical protein
MERQLENPKVLISCGCCLSLPHLNVREYFLDAGGRLAKEVRANHLKAAGHRRCSIDLSSFLCKQVPLSPLPLPPRDL